MKRFLIGVFAICLVSFLCAPVFAGWLSWVGVGCSVVAAVGATVATGGTATGIAITGLILEVGCLTGDIVVTTVSQNGTGSSGPSVAALPPYISEFADAELPLLDVPAGETASLVIATNAYITEVNNLYSLSTYPAPDFVVAMQCLEISSKIDGMRQEIEQLGFGGQTFSVSQLEIGKAQILTTGLPAFEQDYMIDAGFSQSFIDDLAQLHSIADCNQLTTTTLSQIFQQASDKHVELALQVMAVPEPLASEEIE